ncbi:unnamed protein product [Ectocarpus sp. 6 AP-2014]
MQKAGMHCGGCHRRCLSHSGALRGLVLLLLALMVVSSERSCCYPFPMQQAFVAPAARPPGLGPARDHQQGLQRQRRRTAGTPPAGRKLLLAPLVGANGGHDSLRQSQPHSCTESSSRSSSRASCWSVAGPTPWAGVGTTRQAPSLVVAAAAPQGNEGGGARLGGERRWRRRAGGVTERHGDQRVTCGREWHRLAAVGTEGGGGGDGEKKGSEGGVDAVGEDAAADVGGAVEEGKEKGDGWVKRSRWRYALAKIKKEPLQILTIPVSAACVGWLTNKLAVEMIFHPLVWRGIPLRVVEGQPLGLLGWQGIVPAKAGVMAERMVDMVTTQLVDVDEVFRRLSPGKVARLLGPEIDSIVQSVYEDLAPGPLTWVPGSFGSGLVPQAVDELKGLRRNMLVGITKDMQRQVTHVLDLKEMVVGEMLRDRSLMVSLFQRCGKAEFKFLVNSGFFFGFLLGVVQMFVWLLYDKPWTLPAGGAVVGYITNWLAIKLIFEPVDPVKLGPFVLQGLFLKRQDEVAADFAEFFSSNVLTSNKLWSSIIDGSRADAFRELVAARVVPFVSRASAVAGANLDPLAVRGLALRAVGKLGDHVHVLHDYTDKTLALRETMTVQMQKMSTRTFEGVLHPVFEEEEFTLIIAGAILGAIAGFLQMLLSTKGVRDAAKKAASLAAEKAAAAADGVVDAGGGLVEGVGAPVQAGAQAIQTGAQVAQTRVQAVRERAVGFGRRVGCTAQRCTESARSVAVAKGRWLSRGGRAAAAAIADRYHRRRRRSASDGSASDGSRSEGSSRTSDADDGQSSSG